MKITFLGTSAQIPTARRNHTGIFLNYDKENILIDCGEGIQRQLRVAKINPGKINRIFLTHLHGDHVFGLPGLLSTLSNSEYNKTLFIYGPKGVKKFIKEFLDFFKIKLNIKVEEVKGKFFENDEFYFFAEKLKHNVESNGYSFVVKDKLRIDKKKLEKLKIKSGKHLANILKGKSIIYGGKKYSSKDLVYEEKGKKVCVILDTLYQESLKKFAKDSDLLICESSFSSSNSKEAKEKFHMTAEQAGKIAKNSKSSKLILTHISQRYEKNLKELMDDAKKNFSEVKIAKDFDSYLV